jgi:hypothetical protein
MPEPVSIKQVLLLKDESLAKELDRALWATFQEAEAFFNFDRHRAEFSRFYVSDKAPGSLLDPFFGRWRDLKFLEIHDDFWTKVTGKFSRTYDQKKLAELVASLIPGQTGNQLIVTDQEITPPKGWNYILSDTVREGSVVSIAPADPRYWRERENGRIAMIKQRLRALVLGNIGEFLGLQPCDNEHCFLFSDVDSVLRLDEMVLLGDEHGWTQLAGRGFLPNADPFKVQSIVEVTAAGGAVS